MAKHVFCFLFALCSVISLLAFISCSEEITIESCVLGTAEASPSTLKNGDEITLTIGGTSVSSFQTVNGKKYYPVVYYLVDGKEVATAVEKQLPFTAKWVAKDLSVGEHTLSVNITPSREGATYENKVYPSKITVIE